MKKLVVEFGGERVILQDESEDKLIAALRGMIVWREVHGGGRLFPSKAISFFKDEGGIASVSHAIAGPAAV